MDDPAVAQPEDGHLIHPLEAAAGRSMTQPRSQVGGGAGEAAHHHVTLAGIWWRAAESSWLRLTLSRVSTSPACWPPLSGPGAGLPTPSARRSGGSRAGRPVDRS